MKQYSKFKKGQILKFHCNSCKRETNHELVHFVESKYDEIEEHNGEPYLLFSEYVISQLWICRGCDTTTLRKSFAHDGDTDANGNMYWSNRYFPSRNHTEWVTRRYRNLDKKHRPVYSEIISSFNAGNYILCAIGLRALLEGICKSKGITDKIAWGLKDKLKKLGSDKHVPDNIVEALQNHKIIGDDAAHRLEIPSKQELALAIEVICSAPLSWDTNKLIFSVR